VLPPPLSCKNEFAIVNELPAVLLNGLSKLTGLVVPMPSPVEEMVATVDRVVLPFGMTAKLIAVP